MTGESAFSTTGFAEKQNLQIKYIQHQVPSDSNMEKPDDTNIVLLAQELNSLSLQERNRAIESLHGVDHVIKETPAMIRDKLLEFQIALECLLQADSSISRKITAVTRNAYLQAQHQSPSYVQNPAFRLMFLRAESFDAMLAAHRMLVYLEEKLSRFGPDALTRSLTLQDLSPQAMAMLLDLGIHQLLPSRDSAGRAIYLVHADDSVRDLMRQDPMATTNLTFYLLSAAAEDEETQKRGIVSLQIISVLPKMEDMEVIRMNAKRGNTCDWSPVQVKANHIWAKTLSNNPLIRVILNTWSQNARVRLRIHTGSYTELKYHLLTFGIPSNCLPYSMDGEELRISANQRWVNRRKVKEAMVRGRNEFRALDLPGCRDVCLGRGSASHQHSGNVMMRALMSTLIDEYRVADSQGRKRLNKRLVTMVREGGGRFLTKTSGGWYEEVKDEVEIENKVGASFRGMISRTTVMDHHSSGKEGVLQARDDAGVNWTNKRPRLDFQRTSFDQHCFSM